jgi:hypothetical protein
MITGENQDKSKNISPVFYFTIAICLIFGAIYLYKQNAGAFLTASPVGLSAQGLIGDFPFTAKRLFSFFPLYFMLFIKGIFIPFCVLLLPALILLSKVFSDLKKSEISIGSILSNPKNERIFLVIVFSLGMIACLLVYFNVLMDFHPFEDEYSYLWALRKGIVQDLANYSFR